MCSKVGCGCYHRMNSETAFFFDSVELSFYCRLLCYFTKENSAIYEPLCIVLSVDSSLSSLFSDIFGRAEQTLRESSYTFNFVQSNEIYRIRFSIQIELDGIFPCYRSRFKIQAKLSSKSIFYELTSMPRSIDFLACVCWFFFSLKTFTIYLTFKMNIGFSLKMVKMTKF